VPRPPGVVFVQVLHDMIISFCIVFWVGIITEQIVRCGVQRYDAPAQPRLFIGAPLHLPRRFQLSLLTLLLIFGAITISLCMIKVITCKCY